jgi:FMN phosphatase YigB (HAD superfamily)
LLALKVLPFVPDVLDKLKRIKANEVSLRLGVISNTGTETLSKMRSVIAKAGLLEFFDPALLLFSSVEGIDKRQKQFFELAPETVADRYLEQALRSKAVKETLASSKRD